MAYVLKTKDTKTKLPYLPEQGELKNGTIVVFDHYQESDIQQLFDIFEKVIDEGQTYPQDCVDSIDDFKKYYLSHDAFVVRRIDSGEILGAFYVKPNFPGRSSHICNAGFMVKDAAKGQGVGKFLVPKFLAAAKDLGYQASFFNLVYETNIASLKLWDSFGFQRVGRIPKAGNLKGLGYVDAIQYYYNLVDGQKSK